MERVVEAAQEPVWNKIISALIAQNLTGSATRVGDLERAIQAYLDSALTGDD